MVNGVGASRKRCSGEWVKRVTRSPFFFSFCNTFSRCLGSETVRKCPCSENKSKPMPNDGITKAHALLHRLRSTKRDLCIAHGSCWTV